MNRLTYKSAGVDIKLADSFLRRAKSTISSTFTPGVLTDIGHFGAFFKPEFGGMSEPVIVASTDGVGTKLKVAQSAGIHDTVGQDLVNHCVNDILCAGAVPLFFMDYLAMGKLEEDVALDIIGGICRAAGENDAAVIGGETAEMPGLYQPGEYDLAGTIVGLVDKSEIINGSQISPGDILLGLPSTGLHTNGYSLARKICFEVKGFKVDDHVDELGCSIGEELLRIHRSYLMPMLELKKCVDIKGLAHITGGGIVGNTSRIIPESFTLQVDWDAWEIPQIFRFLQEWGGVSEEEMRLTFNLGIGFIVIVAEIEAEKTLETLRKLNEKATIIGQVS